MGNTSQTIECVPRHCIPGARTLPALASRAASRFQLQINPLSTNLQFMRGDRIPFSHLLPVIDLALLVLLVIVPITMTSLHLYQASKGANQVQIHSGQFDMTLPRDQIVPWAIRTVTVSKARTIKKINMPGTFFDILISLPTSWPSTWHPAALLPETWDALVYPFFCLPFWWLIGCGLDCLLGRQRFHWSLLLVGTLLFGLCLTLALGLSFVMSAAERKYASWPPLGLTGWTIAFAVLPIAWIMQAIRSRPND
jgi:hypothetical protein